MGPTGRRVLIALAAVAALIAVIAGLPRGDARDAGTAPAPVAAVRHGAVVTVTGPAVTIPPLPAGSGRATPATEPSTTSSPGAPATATGRASSGLPASPHSRTPSPSVGSPAPRTTARSTGNPSPDATEDAPATTTNSGTPVPRPGRSTASATRHAAATAPPPGTPAPHSAPRTTPSTAPNPPPPNFGIPVSLGDARQLITVTASSSAATTGVLRAWQERSDGRWVLAYGPYPAWLGSAGIGPASEYVSHTPLGTFTLTQAFGRLADPGTALPYHQTNPDDWWVSDVHSPDYNTLQHCAAASCPFDTSNAEHLYYITPYYDYAVVMDVNRWPAVPGKGSAFFLHVTDHRPTAGCVAIDRSALVTIMRWLDPAQHPRIATGTT